MSNLSVKHKCSFSPARLHLRSHKNLSMSVGESGGGGPRWNKRARRRWQPFESRRESCVKRYDNELIGGSFLVADSNLSAESSFGVLPVGRRDHRRFEFVAAGFWRSSLWRIQSKTVRLPQGYPWANR